MSHEWSDGGAEARRTRRRARRQELLRRRRLGAAVTLGAVVVVAGAALEGGPATRSAGTGRPASTRRGGAGSRPFDGRLLIADRGNNRLLVVDAAKHVVWRYPARSRPAPRGGFYFPDDAFFVAHGTAILSNRPGSIVEFTRAGHIVWRYRLVRGPGMLDHPSLAERLPNGLIAVNDDYRHRVALIDPASRKIVWQYGLTDQKGSRTGLLNTPDGFDLLAPPNRSSTHPQTG